MAFTVAPTSGEAPYTFEASFEAGANLNTDRYTLLLNSSEASGSCPALGSSTPLVAGASQLLASGVYISNASVLTGFCRAYTLSVRDNVLGTSISSETLTISNV